MPREYDDHFGVYSYVCPDWKEHLQAWAAANPDKVDFDLEDLDDVEVGEVSLHGTLMFGEEAMDSFRTYGIIRYAAIDEGDDSCPTCKQTIDFASAQEVDSGQAQAWLKRQKTVEPLLGA
jgi:hypothetical protein